MKKNFIEKFQEHLKHYERQYVIRRGDYKKHTSYYYRNDTINIRRLDSLARLLNNNNDDCVAICLYKKHLYIAANEADKNSIERDLKTIIEEIKPGKQYQDIVTFAEKYKGKKRMMQDARKILVSLTSRGTRRIGRSKKRKARKFVELKNALIDKPYTIINNKQKLHAEIRIIEYLIQQGMSIPFKDIKFGISKLCCALCAMGMDNIGCKCKKHYRAIHGNFYNQWLLPNFIIKNKTRLKKFLGTSAFEIYKKASSNNKKSY